MHSAFDQPYRHWGSGTTSPLHQYLHRGRENTTIIAMKQTKGQETASSNGKKHHQIESNGFRKGFLLCRASKKSHPSQRINPPLSVSTTPQRHKSSLNRPSTTSNTLLDWEDTSVSHHALLVTGDKGHMIAKPHEDDPSYMPNTGGKSTQNDTSLTAISTTRKGSGRVTSLDSDLLLTGRHSTSDARIQSVCKDDLDNPSWLLDEPPTRRDAEQRNNTSWIDIRKQLSRTLVRLQGRNKHHWRSIAYEFVSTITEERQAQFAWTFLLESNAFSSQPNLRLCACLVEHDCRPLVSFLKQYNGDKKRRQIVMRCLNVLEFYVSLSDQSEVSVGLVLLDDVLPVLIHIITSSSTRTNLVQAAGDIAVDLLGWGLDRFCGGDGTKGPDMSRHIQHIDAILDVHIGWTKGSKDISSETFFAPDASRFHCHLALLQNWKSLYRQYADNEVPLATFCEQLQGSPLELNSGSIYVGSWKHSLQSGWDIDPSYALQALEQLEEATPESNTDESFNLDSIVRAIAGWIYHEGKRLYNSPLETLDRIETTMVDLLQRTQSQMVPVSLRCFLFLISRNHFCAQDMNVHNVSNQVTSLPSSFVTLLDLLRRHYCNLEEIDRDLIVQILARWLSKRPDLLPCLLRHNDDDLLINVLRDLLRALLRLSEANSPVAGAILDHLLSQHFMSQTVRVFLFSDLPIVGQLIRNNAVPVLIMWSIKCMNKVDDEGVSLSFDLMRHIMMPFVSRGDFDPLIDFLSSLRGYLRSSAETDVLESLLLKLADHWRAALFSEGDVILFPQFLSAIASGFMRNPSCNATLAFFGRFAGSADSDSSTVVEDQNKDHNATRDFPIQSLHHGMIGIVRMCVCALNDTQEIDDIFQRLAPLLLLRRLPVNYFRLWDNPIPRYQPPQTPATISTPEDIEGELNSLFISLTQQLTHRMGILVTTNETRARYTPQERLLAAEIAGRCLPFARRDAAIVESAVICCCYDMVVRPAFVMLEKQALSSKSDGNRDPERQIAIRAAKTALYTTCTACSYASPHDPGMEFSWVADFVIIHILNHPNPDSDLESLRMGCMEFVVQCFQAHFRFSLNPHLISAPTGTIQSTKGGVQRQESSRSVLQQPIRDFTGRSNVTFVDACKRITTNLLWVMEVPGRRYSRVAVQESRSLSLPSTSTVSTRNDNHVDDLIHSSSLIVLWNALSVLAQRCTTEYLYPLSENVVPIAIQGMGVCMDDVDFAPDSGEKHSSMAGVHISLWSWNIMASILQFLVMMGSRLGVTRSNYRNSPPPNDVSFPSWIALMMTTATATTTTTTTTTRIESNDTKTSIPLIQRILIRTLSSPVATIRGLGLKLLITVLHHAALLTNTARPHDRLNRSHDDDDDDDDGDHVQDGMEWENDTMMNRFYTFLVRGEWNSAAGKDGNALDRLARNDPDESVRQLAGQIVSMLAHP